MGFKRSVIFHLRRMNRCVAEDGGLDLCLWVCNFRFRRLSDCSPNTDVRDLSRGLLSSVFGDGFGSRRWWRLGQRRNGSGRRRNYCGWWAENNEIPPAGIWKGRGVGFEKSG